MTTTPPKIHTTLVTIPACTATHIIGTSTLPLASGTMTLLKSAQAPANHQSAHTEERLNDNDHHHSHETSPPPLTLQLGPLAFPLAKDTLFGTDATSPRAYMFVPKMEGIGGYVRLELPEWAGEAGPKERSDSATNRDLENLEPLQSSSTAKSADESMNTSLQDTFEQILISYGLLKEGWDAVRDEIGRGVIGAFGEIRDKVVGGLSTDTGRVPPEALEEDKE